MKPIFTLIAVITLVSNLLGTSHAQVLEVPTTETSSVVSQENKVQKFQQLVRGYYDAFARKDASKVLSYMHPKGPGIIDVEATMEVLFPVVTFKNEISKLKILGIDGDFAFVRYTKHFAAVALTTEKNGWEPADHEMLDVFRKDGSKWKLWSTETLVSTPRPNSEHATSTQKSDAGLKPYIDPAAKTILDRAAKLYGSTAKWRGELAFRKDWANGNATISFERPKKLRVQKQNLISNLLVIVDGKSKSLLVDEEVTVEAQWKPVEITLSENGKGFESEEGIATTIAFLLQGQTGLDGKKFSERAYEASTVNIKQLHDAPFKNLKCQRVVIDIRYRHGDIVSPNHHREELWFTTEGKLLRAVGYQQDQGKKKGEFRKILEWDDEITNQNFAPVFDEKNFVFTAPKPKKK